MCTVTKVAEAIKVTKVAETIEWLTRKRLHFFSSNPSAVNKPAFHYQAI